MIPYPAYVSDTLKEQLDRIFWAIMEEEGGFVNDPDDTGGPTRYGISHAFLLQQYEDHPDTYFECFPDGDTPPTIETMRGLTKSQAKFLFFECFAEPLLPLGLPLNLMMEVTDFAFNASVRQSIRTLQRALNEMDGRTFARNSYPSFLVIDGVWGPKSAKALRYWSIEAGKSKIEASFRKERWIFYKGLIKKKPVYKKYRNGWKARAFSYKL